MSASAQPSNVSPPKELSDHHDALVLTGAHRKLYRFAHVEGSPDFNDPPVELKPEDEGYRKVVNLAEGEGCHMALATLPIREEPASEFLSCYLTNTERVTFRTPWVNELNPVPPDLLIVNQASKVFHFKKQDNGYAAEPPKELPDKQKNAILDLVGSGPESGADGDTMAVAFVPGGANPTTRPSLLINALRLEFVNPWTSAAWTQGPQVALRLDAVSDADARVVLAWPDELFDVTIQGGQATIKKLQATDATRVRGLLGKGMVLGGVKLSGARKPVNLINLPALKANEFAGDTVKLLLATATGSVLNLAFDPATITDSPLTVNLGEEVDVKKESEVWRLLRNGCIAGGVSSADGPSMLVNLSAFSPVAVGQGNDPEKYSGTYDFRWKAGSTLKVLVQAPASLSVLGREAVVDKIEKLALSWTKLANITLQVQAASTPLAVGTAYDILVNLEDLPVTTIEKEAGAKTFTMTNSALGSYASRQSFGIPTMYLGWNKQLKDANGTIPSQQQYFDSVAFEHFVLHELGHALGLPHLHQHPDLINPFKDSVPSGEIDRNNLPKFEAMKAEVEGRMGLKLDSLTILEEFILRWPKKTKFNDWPNRVTVLNGIAPQEFLDSVMMALPVRGLLAGQASGPLTYRNTLSDFDQQWLAQVYPK